LSYLVEIVAIGLIFYISFLIKKKVFKNHWAIQIGMLSGFILLALTYYFKLEQVKNNLLFYIDILLCIISASFPLTVKKFDKLLVQQTKSIMFYSIFQHLFQWASAIIIFSFVFSYFFENVGTYLAASLPGGFVGGFGAAAVLDSIFKQLNILDFLSVSITMATIGTFVSLFGGLYWIKKQGVSSLKEVVSEDYVIPKLRAFFLFTICVILSFFASKLCSDLFNFKVPMLASGIGVGILIRPFVIKSSVDMYDISNFSVLATSALVAVSIGAIKIVVVKTYLLPIVLIAIFGIVSSIFIYKFMGIKGFKEFAFEKSLFTWGWSTGGIVYGVALTQMIRNKKNARIIPILAMSYIMLSPLEVSLIILMPKLLLTNYINYIGFGLLLLSVLCCILHFKQAKK
jgi:ESS family glutamate:Na+ symporter